MRAVRGRCGSVVAIAAVVLAIGCGGAGAERASTTTTGASSGAAGATSARAAAPDPEQILRDMAARLAQAQSLTFEADRRMDPALIQGGDALEVAHITVAVERPDKLYAVARTSRVTHRIYFDGRRLTVYDPTRRSYADLEVPGSIDQMIAGLEERFGFVPPLAEFIANHPYALIGKQIQTSRYVGAEPVRGELCDHVAVSGRYADADLWIGQQSELPRRLVAVYHLPGAPRLRVDFSSWDLSATLDPHIFAFTPPESATRIDMVRPSELDGDNT